MRSLFPLLLSLIACGQQDGDSNGPDTVRDSGDSGIDTDSGTPTDTFDPTEALALYDKDEDTYLDESVKEYQYYNQLVSSSNTPEDVRRHIASGLWDCNDTPPSPDGSDNGGADIHPETTDNTQDGVDNNCDGSIDEDYVAPADPVVDIVFDGEPAVVQVDDLNDISQGLPIALGDIDGDGADDLLAVTAMYGTYEGKLYAFTNAVSSLVAGVTQSISRADIQAVGGEAWAGLYTVATADSDGNEIDEVYLGFAASDTVVAVNNITTSSSISFADVWQRGIMPTGLDGTIVEGNGEGIGQHIISIGDVDGDGSVSLLVSGGDFCGILNLADFILGSFMDYTEVTTHEITQPYYDGSICSNSTKAGDIDGDGDNDLIIPSTSTTFNGSAGHGWISRIGNTGYYVDLPSATAPTSDDYLFWSGAMDGDASGIFPAIGDFDGDGIADVCLGGYGIDNGHTNSGAANCIFGAEFAAKWPNPDRAEDPDSGVLHNGDNFTVGYTGPVTGADFDLTIFDNPKSFYGDVENAQLTSHSSDTWSDPINYPGIGLLAMGASSYAGMTNGAVFVSRYNRASETSSHEIIVSSTNGDTKLEGPAGGFLGGTVLFGDLNGDGVPDLVSTAEETGQIYIWYGRAVHQSEVSG